MIRGLRTHEGGFSLVELMIVMSITIALLGSALLVFQGRVPRTQFASAINGLNTQLTDISNQVTTGYYPNQNTITCESDGVNLNITNTGTDTLGRNSDCIYLGQVVHFGAENGSTGSCSTASPGQNCDTIDIYTVYGARQQSGGALATSLSESDPQITDVNKTSVTLGYGAHVMNIKVDGVTDSIGAVAFLQSFGGNRDLLSSVPTGAAQVNTVPLVGTAIGTPQGDFITNVNGYAPASARGLYSVQNPKSGILICLKSGGSDQYALINIAVGGAPSSSEVRIVEEGEWSAKCS